MSNKNCGHPCPDGTSAEIPVRVPVLVIQLADLKAKPDANHANAHPKQDWSCQICNQHCAMSPSRRTGFKPDTTRTNYARTGVTRFAFIMAAILSIGNQPRTCQPRALGLVAFRLAMVPRLRNLWHIMQCIIPGCQNIAENNFSVRCRRPSTRAIWAPNTEAFLCDQHARQGLRITVTLEPTNDGRIDTLISSPGGQVVQRRTPITNNPA
jgi:hypothetical protein